jgi:hypothetical protein
MTVASACLDFELENINQESKRSLGSEKQFTIQVNIEWYSSLEADSGGI